VMGINQWIIVAVFVFAGLALFRWFERKGL